MKKGIVKTNRKVNSQKKFKRVKKAKAKKCVAEDDIILQTSQEGGWNDMAYGIRWGKE